GGALGRLIWGAPYPGDPAFESRMYIAHVFVFPIIIGTLIALHLTLVASRHHTQFRRPGRQSGRKVLGVPMFPGQAPRSLGLMAAVAGVLFLLGGLVQINPIWRWAERRFTRDRSFHNVLDRPRDAPWRTALGAGVLTFVLLVFFVGSADRAFVSYQIDYNTQIWIYRVLCLVLPPLVTWLTLRICRGLQRADEIEHDREEAEGESAAAAA